MNAECPVCDANIHVGGDVYAGKLVDCQACGRELEVISLQPLVLADVSSPFEDLRP